MQANFAAFEQEHARHFHRIEGMEAISQEMMGN